MPLLWLCLLLGLIILPLFYKSSLTLGVEVPLNLKHSGRNMRIATGLLRMVGIVIRITIHHGIISLRNLNVVNCHCKGGIRVLLRELIKRFCG